MLVARFPIFGDDCFACFYFTSRPGSSRIPSPNTVNRFTSGAALGEATKLIYGPDGFSLGWSSTKRAGTVSGSGSHVSHDSDFRAPSSNPRPN
jgi:hypothetical protein